MGPDGPRAGTAPVVLFISGWGRSGSTLLDRLMGELPGAVSVGEVWNVWMNGFVRDELCGCGSAFGSCPFWSAVAERAFGGVGAVDGRRVRRRMRSVARLKALPRLVTGRVGAGSYRRAFDDYGATLTALYEAIAAESGAAVIIDSSKTPQHGFLLNRLPGVRLTMVHLVRDSRAVAFSWQRHKERPEGTDRSATIARYPPGRSAVSWLLANLLSEGLRRLAPTSLRVRYEDLVAEPSATLARVAALVGLAPPGPAVDGGLRLGPAHTAAGNPMRFATGPIELRADDEWAGRSWPGRGVVGALTWPLLLRYGYRLRPSCRPGGGPP